MKIHHTTTTHKQMFQCTVYTFGTNPRCSFNRDVHLIKSQLQGVKKGRDQLWVSVFGRCPSYGGVCEEEVDCITPLQCWENCCTAQLSLDIKWSACACKKYYAQDVSQSSKWSWNWYLVLLAEWFLGGKSFSFHAAFVGCWLHCIQLHRAFGH